MPAYSGKFQYLDERGTSLQQGPCELSFDTDTCVVTPASGMPLAFDLGDVDQTAPGEWELDMALYTGRRIQLRQFGAAFGRMLEELLAAWRDRTVRCLLLEDLEELGRFDATANGGAAQVRLYRSNLAVLPLKGMPLQWRLADVDSAVFQDASYSLHVQAGDETLVLAKLAKRTDEFRGMLSEALGAMRKQTATVLHQAFPFLNPDQLQRTVMSMPEGRSVALSALQAIHCKLADSLLECAVDESLKPYFDALRQRAAGDLMAGFKFVRDDEAAADEGEAEAGAGENRLPLFFWFWIPVAKDKVAWEATSGSGRATYFFRTELPIDAAVRHLTRGLALVNFRREPVYLPDESLEQQARYHRYAIGARKLPDLRTLRKGFMGRALHTSPEAWQEQVRNLTEG